ncbi:DMT family transporter [Candidatus Latescibacterota bacterium]
MRKWKISVLSVADSAMIVACFFWAVGTVLTKDSISDTHGGFKVYVFNTLRLYVATGGIFVYSMLTGENIKLRRDHILRMACLAFIGMFLFMVIFHLGLTMTTATHAGVLIGTIPLFIILISALTGVERPTLWMVGGVIVGFAGVAALTSRNGRVGINTGDALVILSCICWAVYTVFGKTVLKYYSPVVSMAWIFFFTSIYHTPIFFLQVTQQSWGDISPKNWINMVVAALGALFVSNTLYYYSLDKIGPTRAGIYTNLEPAFTLLLAYMIGLESMSANHIIGFITITAGIGLTKLSPVSEKP